MTSTDTSNISEEIDVRLPLFGYQKVTLYEKVTSDGLSLSHYVFQKIKNTEIKRLDSEVMHLGVVHEIGDVPKFSRWNHITMMLVLIDKIAQLYKDKSSVGTLGISISSPVKLKNGVKFRSAEDFLKCWAMVYSIGHFVGTFASEHALLKCIVANEEFKDNFLKALDEKFRSYLNDDIAESIKTVCKDILKIVKISLKFLKYLQL